MNRTIKVQYYEDDSLKVKKDLEWPQKYENFIEDIRKNFKLGNKIEITLKLITEDDDPYDISSQEDLDDYLKDNNIKEFKFYTSGENEDNLSGGFDGEGNANDDDLEKLLNSKMNIEELNVDNMINEIFDDKNFEKNLEENNNKYADILKSNLEKSMNDILEGQKKEMEKEINLKLTEFSNLSISIQKNACNKISDFKEELNNIKDQTAEMYEGINELHDSIAKNELVLSSANNIINHANKKEKIDMSNVQNVNNNNQKPKLNNQMNVNPIDDEYNNDENEVNINYDKNKIYKELDIKEAKFFTLDGFSIMNNGNTSYKNLNIVIDKENSDKDIIFSGNDKNADLFGLTMNGDLKPQDSQNVSLALSINEPKVDSEYKMTVYVREKNKDKNISQPLEICIKVKQYEDPIQKKQNEAVKIYEELKKQFVNYENLINKDEIIDKYMSDKLDIEEYKNNINSKIKEQQNEEKAEQIYKKLNLDNLDIQRDEIIAYIKEQNFEEDKVQNWINEKINNKKMEKAEKIYNELFNELSFPDKNAALNKIIELNFNIEEIKKLFQPTGETNATKDVKADEIFSEVDGEYGISSFMDEDEVKAKIKELNYDKDQISAWVEEVLLNNPN